MWPRFGIKIGNSTLCIAYVKADGSVDVIANKQGDRVSHACLLWNTGDDIECGLTAKQKLATKPKQGVANSFQLLLPPEELDENKIESALKDIPCVYDVATHNFILENAASDSDENKKEKKQLCALDVHVQLLTAELELARQYHSDASQKPIVVLSIPSYYPTSAWNLLAEAADKSGFHVAQVVAESTAALLAYRIGEESDEQKAKEAKTKYILTIKSGGLWSYFTLYAVNHGLYTKLQNFGPFPSGGRKYDEVVVQYICDEFQRKFKLDPRESRRSMAKIRTAVVNCKQILTQMPSTQVYIDSLMDGIDFNMQMSRARFESLIQPVIADFMATLSQSVESALAQNKDISQIDAIVLLGGTTQIPKLKAALEARFPGADLYASLPSNEAVAIGCARQGSFLIDPESGVELRESEQCAIVDDDLLIWHGENEEKATTLVKKGDMLPTTVHVNVEPCKEAKTNTTFRLRVGDEIYEADLAEATIAEDGLFHIEAEVEDPSVDSMQTTSFVRLKCL